MQKLKFKNLLIFNASILLRFGTNIHQYVSKTCFEFHIKMTNNFRATVYQIAVPLASEVEICLEIGGDLKLRLYVLLKL